MVRDYQILMYNEHKKIKSSFRHHLYLIYQNSWKNESNTHKKNSPFDLFPTLPRFSTLKNATYQDWQENPSSIQYFKSVLYQSPVIHYLLHIIFFKIHINVVTN